MDAQTLISYLSILLSILPLAHSFFFTNLTDLYGNDTQSSWYSNQTEDDMNVIQSLSTIPTQIYTIPTQSFTMPTQSYTIPTQSYTTPTTPSQINIIDTTTEQLKKQQEFIITTDAKIEQPNENYEILIKNDTEKGNASIAYGFFGMFDYNDTETEPTDKAYEAIPTKDSITEPPKKIYDIIAKKESEEKNLNIPIEITTKSTTEPEQLKNIHKQTEKNYTESGKLVKSVPIPDQTKKQFENYAQNFKNYDPSPSIFYKSPPEYNPNLSKTPNFSPFLLLKGKYCETRPGAKCCPNRQDDCSVPVLGTLCYCDHFCDRAPNKQGKHASPDCCPDFYNVCTNVTRDEPSSHSTGWSPWSACSKTCGIGEERRTQSTNYKIETQRRPCLVSRCPIPPQAQCGGLYRAASGTIDYPGGSGNYPNEANCRWIIATQPYTTLELSILSFSTQRQHDYLTIREHNISTFSANISGIMEGVIMTASNIVTLVFTSDSYITDSGFVINWKEKLTPNLSVEVWMCKDSWPGEECFFDKGGSNGGLVCNCKDAQARGWCDTDYRNTRRVCEATCNPMCTPNVEQVIKELLSGVPN